MPEFVLVVFIVMYVRLERFLVLGQFFLHKPATIYQN